MSLTIVGFVGIIFLLFLLFSRMWVGATMMIVGILGSIYIGGPDLGKSIAGMVPFSNTASYTMACIPIPIPLFYDKVEFTYNGMEGIQSGLGFRFPEPKFDLKEAIALVKSLYSFFSQKPYYFNTRLEGDTSDTGLPKGAQMADNKLPESMDVTFEINPCFSNSLFKLSSISKELDAWHPVPAQVIIVKSNFFSSSSIFLRSTSSASGPERR